MSVFSISDFETIKPLEKLIILQDQLYKLEEQIGDDDKKSILLSKKDICEQELLSLKQKIDKVQNQSIIYECPSCQTSLSFKDTKLVISSIDKQIDTSLSEQTLKIDYNKKQKELDSVQKELILLERITEEYNQQFDKFESTLTKLNLTMDDDFSLKLDHIKKNEKAFGILKSNISDVERKIKCFKDTFKDKFEEVGEKDKNYDETFIFHIIEEITKVKEMIKNYSDINTRLLSLQTQKLNINNVIDPVDSIKETKEKIKEYEEKIETYTTLLNELQTWKRIEDTNNKYIELQEMIQKSKDAKDYMIEEVKCCEKLLYYIKDAETKAIFDFIDTLNHHAALYIEDFFPDEDIQVQLITNKELKSGKEKLGLFFEVNYKTMKGDTEFLSGGQRDRVNLAFTLAFSELVQNRILLLDECISSLDNETSDTVIDTLKEKYKGKLIICVAHQVNTGVFDQVIKI